MDLDPTSVEVSGLALLEANGHDHGAEEISFRDDPTGRTPAIEDTGEALDEGIAEAGDSPAILTTPILLLNRVSGRYRSSGGAFELELRVDLDGTKPMKRFSGDFFQVSGATKTYYGSFIVHTPVVASTSSSITAEGIGQFTWSSGAPKIRVTIPRTKITAAPAAATLRFFTTSGSAGATYLCPFASKYFRTVQWEQDFVAGTVPFVSYNTGSLPQPGGSPARVLSISKAYAEAGIEMQTAGVANQIAVSAAGADGLWTDSEMHAAMVKHFSLWKDVPQWKVWVLVATAHAEGARGIMFDYSGAFQRQGCAVFYNAIKGTDAANQRAQLRTYVHELGHCFNLLHSWDKAYATPPAPLGPNGGLGDLSWMNYAWKYQPPAPAPGGEAAYWSNFPFQFTNNELVHLRHAFHNNAVLGGNAFAKGAAEVDPELFADRVEDNSGLRLELRSKDVFTFGEPVVVELKLSATDTRGKTVHTHLHPKASLVQIAIRQPSGRTVRYRPLMEQCVEDDTVRLGADQSALYDSAYIGYGKDGFYFDQPGAYQLRAIYVAPDGSRVVSPTLDLHVRSPYSATDEDVGLLLMDGPQGQLLYLLGSDAESLQSGNDAFDTVLDRYADHPLAVYARLVKGVNAARDFKRVQPEKRVDVRAARPEESAQLLSAVVEASKADAGVDNITLSMVGQRLAQVQKKAGDIQQAVATTDRMVDIFKKKGLRAEIVKQISEEAKVQKQRLRDS